MNIDSTSPLIIYSAKGKPFNYEKLFLNTVDKYIVEYKNVGFEQLTDKDRSISLARIIKKMEVNGVPVTEFFKDDLEKWSKFDNYKKILCLIEAISRDIFGCFDPNRETSYGDFYRTDRLYYINNGGQYDFFMYQDTEKKSLFNFKKTKENTPRHMYFKDLMERFNKGMLPKVKKD